MIKYLILLAFLPSCAEFMPTHNAQVRNTEQANLLMCLESHPCSMANWCLEESVARCRRAGIEVGCGADGLWGTPYHCK
jgi:hypothetical protein